MCLGRMAQWLKEEPERRRELSEEKRKRLERKRAGPRHNYNDPTYMEQIRNTEETMDDALKQGDHTIGETIHHVGLLTMTHVIPLSRP